MSARAIHIRELTGKIICVHGVKSTDTIAALKAAFAGMGHGMPAAAEKHVLYDSTKIVQLNNVFMKTNPPGYGVRLMFAGKRLEKQLEDHRTLEEYNLQHMSIVQVTVRLRGD